MEEKQLTCKICGTGFLFSVNEQIFYKSRVLAEPKRCPECRAKRRQEMKGKVMENGSNSIL